MRGRPIRTASAEQLAILLAAGVMEAKGRTAFAEVWPPTESKPLRIFRPPLN
jgi:hypothetical protein